MSANEELIDRDNEISRASYIKKIVEKLQSESYTLPTPSEEIFYQEALRRLVNLHSDDEFDQPIQDNESKIVSRVHTSSSNVNSHSRGKTRKQMLREILSALKNLERRRLYSPPADNEIAYYQVMRNHIRLIVTFDETVKGQESSELFCEDTDFPHVTRFSTLSYVMELEELSSQLKDISSHLCDMDTRNGFILKPVMGVMPNFKESANSSNEIMSNRAFYQHKFMLAYVDLWSSDMAASPPKIDEKKLYDIIINYKGAPSSSEESSDKKESVPFRLDDLPYLFYNRIAGVMDNSMRHCMDIMSSILEKLSICSTFDNLVKCYKNNHQNMVQEFLRHCKVSDKGLLDYIAEFDRCILIAKYIYRITSVCSTANCYIQHILSYTYEGIVHRETEWELIHALTISNSASFEFPDEYVETEDYTMLSEKDESDNVIILRGILQDLEHIGNLDSNCMLDEEETDLFNKILKKVASAVDFFYSAVAYQQRGMMQPSISSDGIRKVGRLKKRKLNFDSWEGYHKFYGMLHNLDYLESILKAIKQGLVEKPIRNEIKRNMLCSMNCSMQNVICRDTCLQRRSRLSSNKNIDW